MLLSPIEIELVLLLQRNYLYPKTKEELIEAIRVLDKDVLNKEKILSKTYIRCVNIEDFFKDYTEDKVQNIISHIL